MWPCRVHGFLFPSAAFPGCLCAGMSQAGNFYGKDFSQSEQQIPSGAWGQLLAGQGLLERAVVDARATPTPLHLRPLSSHPLRRGKHLSPRWARPGGTWAPGAAGLRRGSGKPWRQRVLLTEERTWPWPHFLQLHVSHGGAASDSILRWGCACQTQALWPMEATQPWWSLSPVSVLHSVGPTMLQGLVPFLSDLSPVPFVL